MPEKRFRLFFALWPPPTVREQLARLARKQVSEGRRVPAENLHLTLAFIGAADAGTCARLLALAASVEGDASVLYLNQIGSWPRRGIAWIAPARVPEGLQRLHRSLHCRLAQAGLRSERRPFRPHVTLARRAASIAPQHVPTLAWPVEAFALVASTPAPGGVHYRTLSQWPLRTA